MSWPVANATQMILRRLDPERAHALTLSALERGLGPKANSRDDACLSISAMGLNLPNPVGVAAGFDKDARVPDAVLDMGFGFAEVGTITPNPQPGNPRPRVFRLPKDGAIINRNGFNNDGHDAALARLSARDRSGCVGINLGANKDSTDRNADYVTGVTRFYDYASYFMVNVSSPNTPGLRDLQAPDAVAALLSSVISERDRIAEKKKGRRVPVAIKLAPDIAEDDLDPIVERIMTCAVDAIAVSNTTIARPDRLKSKPDRIAEPGGLSGRPLFDTATIMLARVHRLSRGKVPLIGIGGIDTGGAAIAKVRAGATLIQLYTGLVYEGPALLGAIKSALQRAVRAEGLNTVGDLVGRDRDLWADKPLRQTGPPGQP